MAHTSTSSSAPIPLSQRLLQRAHSPSTAASLYIDKIKQKPLLLRPTAKPTWTSSDARTHRQHVRRLKEDVTRKRKRKPYPLSAKEKRRLGVYDIPKEERKWEIYEGLWKMWCGYMREILNIRPKTSDEIGKEDAQAKARPVYITPAAAGPMLASADFHGAKITCVRSKCAGRVGVAGIVVRDTKFTFVVVTKGNEIKVLPKEGSIFRFAVPVAEEEDNGNEDAAGKTFNEGSGRERSLVFELHGEQFKNRSVDRANKKFKMHIPPGL
jgi:ribonuclease P protein subunit POP4